MKTDFVTWLIEEIKKQGWSNSEFARRAGVVPSTMSMILSQQREPSQETLVGIAQALREPPARVFRKAGIFPPTPQASNEGREEILDYYDALNPERRRTLRVIARALHEEQADYEVNEKRTSAYRGHNEDRYYAQ